jgi:GAF domain
MDHHSTLDRDSAPPAGGSPEASSNQAVSRNSGHAPLSVSARIAAANVSLATLARAPSFEPSSESSSQSYSEAFSESKLRFPGEDGGRSLAAMAERDLDAALQLLAERAQYITGASGAAIALRRGAAHDMLCRASAGSNAPELGALLSTEYGLSGESVRTRRALRCDDAERDPRVNRDGCRQLGIASVVIMPIVGDDDVIGVFELFSGKTEAFNDRDLSALERLGRMVETAVKHAVAFQTRLEIEEFLQTDVPPPVETVPPKATVAPAAALPKSAQPKEENADSKRPLFWSAAILAQSANRPASEAKQLKVPPVLRQLQKCQACGFPVSPGRTFCVECEDKQWRGERLPQPAPEPSPTLEQEIPRETQHPPTFASDLASPHATLEHTEVASPIAIAEILDETRGPENSATTVDAASSETTPVFGSALTPSQSWFAANKFIVGAIIVVAIGVAAIVWLR